MLLNVQDSTLMTAPYEAPTTDTKMFKAVPCCWICGHREAAHVYPAIFRLEQFANQDPELSAYSGSRIWMVRCVNCGFIQPESLPVLTNYFDRIYDQHWSQEWIDREFDSHNKDFIFQRILQVLERRVAACSQRRLLDIGAHVGRFMFLAARAGWKPEGIELNPRTSAYAAKRTGLPVHRANAESLVAAGKHYAAITLTDVLEHIPSPLGILRRTFELLERGGWLALKVPAAPSQFAKERVRAWFHEGCTAEIATNLVHVNHFSPQSLRLALEKCGYQRISITVGAPELADLTIESGLKNRLSNAFRLTVYHAARLLPGGLRTPLALNLQAYAQKA